MAAKKFYVIFNETLGKYWNRVSKTFKGLDVATEYEGGTKENIEQIIMNDPDLAERAGAYSVKTIIRIEKEEE